MIDPTKPHQHLEAFWVMPEFLTAAIRAMNCQLFGTANARVQNVQYIHSQDCFVITVLMDADYPFMGNEWRKDFCPDKFKQK